MMKEQDFRVGDFYMVNGKVEEMGSIMFEFDEGATYIDDFNIRVCKPIPLTEEWLEKFGFNSKYKSIHTHWNLGGFGLDQASDEDDDGNSIPVKQEFYYGYKLEVKYVHQLQNLYYAMTGEELVRINLKESQGANNKL